ncbi:unnamed protein product [Schistosoma turkestanicum]|nr:unnamed protein product [Schistosoma turkestanicum]
MNGIKLNSNQNVNQYDDDDDDNNNLLNFEHISDDINTINVKPFLKQLRCVIGELIESELVYLKSLCDIEETLIYVIRSMTVKYELNLEISNFDHSKTLLQYSISVMST